MKILVIGGMHGNEPLGLELVRQLKLKPLTNVDAVYANERAIDRGVRFIRDDLNRSFPGNITSQKYEQKRAAQLLGYTENFDIVLDFHNTHCPGNDCSFVGESARNTLVDVSGYFGLRRMIVADYDCINKYAPNCISIEVSLNSPRMNARWWYRKIEKLSQLTSIPAARGISTYRFVYRMTLEDRDRLGLPSADLKAFQELEPNLTKKMGVKSPAFPIFINDAYTPYNYGGLLNKIDV